MTSRMDNDEDDEGKRLAGLMGLAPELIHKVALEGWLGVRDVGVLGLVCRRMADILVWDEYGRELHMALRGVVENVRERRWKAAMYAVKRRWFGGEEGGEEGVWRGVVGLVADLEFGKAKVELENEDEVKGWEKVVLGALSLPQAQGWEHGALLHAAARVGSLKVAQWVLERRAACGDSGINLLDVEDGMNRETPVFVACRRGHLALVEYLVEQGANVETGGAENMLTSASRTGDVGLVRYLIEVGVNVDGRVGHGGQMLNRMGPSPLGVACEKGHVEVVRLLLEKGGEEVLVGEAGHSGPLAMACKSGKLEVVTMLVPVMVERGVEGKVWVDGVDAAVSQGAADIVSAVLDGGCVDLKTVLYGSRGMLPLYSACVTGNVDIVRMLVEEGGADVNQEGKSGETPLLGACESGRLDLVRMLVEECGGVDEGGRGEEEARRSGFWDVVEYLSQASTPSVAIAAR